MFTQDLYDEEYVKKVIENNHLLDVTSGLNETVNHNLASSVEDLDDICTSISQQPLNPLYDKSVDNIRDMSSPKKLVNDDRFWREQINLSKSQSAMVNEAKEIVQCANNQEIISLSGLSESSSADTFTPHKKIKDKIPDAITKWTVSLGGTNLVVIGQDKDRRKPVARICQRRISALIFHDSDNIVCSLFGPSDPDKNLPKYILKKFEIGIPEDWKKVIQHWGNYIQSGSSVEYRWPPISRSELFNNHTVHEIEDSDLSALESTNMSFTMDKLSAKIKKMQKRLRAMQLRTILSNNSSNFRTKPETSIRNDKKLIQNVNINHSNLTGKLEYINLNRTPVILNKHPISNNKKSTSKVQNIINNASKNNILSPKNSVDLISYNRKQGMKFVEDSSESEESETDLNKITADNSSSVSDMHLQIDQSSSDQQPLANNENQKTIFQKNDTEIQKNVKTLEKCTEVFQVSSNKENTVSQKSNRKESNSKSELEKNEKILINDHEISESYEGNTRTFFKKNVNYSEVFKIPPDVNICNTSISKSHSQITTKIVLKQNNIKTFLKPLSPKFQCRKEGWNKIDLKLPVEDIIPNKNNSKISLTDKAKEKTYSECSEADISESNAKTSSIKNVSNKGGRKNKIIYDKSHCESPQQEIFGKYTNKNDDAAFLIPSEIDIPKKRNRKKERKKINSESCEEIINIVPNKTNVETFLKTSQMNSPKKRGRKKRWNKQNSESSCEEIVNIVSNKTDAERLLKSSETNSPTKYGRKKRSPYEEIVNVPNKNDAETILKTSQINSPNKHDRRMELNSESSCKEVLNTVPNKNCTEKHLKIILNKKDAEIVLKPEINVTKIRGRRKNKAKKSQAETMSKLSPKENSNVNLESNADIFLKPPNSVVIPKRGRKNGGKNNVTSNQLITSTASNESHSLRSILTDFSSLQKNETSLTNNDISSIISDVTISSRGRKRVPPLPFWQGQRIANLKNGIVIQKSASEHEPSNIENVVNFAQNSTSSINILSKSKKSTKKGDSSLSYDKVFDGNVFKKPEMNNTKMPLMSTFRESLIVNGTINTSDGKVLSPIKEQINIVKSSPKNITNSSNKKISSSRKSSTTKKKSEVEDEDQVLDNLNCNTSRIRKSPVKKHIRKQSKSTKQLNFTAKESNELLNKFVKSIDTSATIHLPPRKRTNSINTKNNELENELLIQSVKSIDTSATIDSPARKRTKSINKKKNVLENENLTYLSDDLTTNLTLGRTRSVSKKIQEEIIDIKQLNSKNGDKSKTEFKLGEENATKRNSKFKNKLRSVNKDNFNFNVHDVTNITENVSGKQIKTREKLVKMGVKKTTQFKVKKPNKIPKIMTLPIDATELSLYIKKKSKKVPTKVIKDNEITVQTSEKTQPTKRKLFRSDDWLNSKECINNLTQNNPKDTEQSPKFVLKYEPGARRREFDEEAFSEVSGVI